MIQYRVPIAIGHRDINDQYGVAFLNNPSTFDTPWLPRKDEVHQAVKDYLDKIESYLYPGLYTVRFNLYPYSVKRASVKVLSVMQTHSLESLDLSGAKNGV